jgi:hypothetical protein
VLVFLGHSVHEIRRSTIRTGSLSEWKCGGGYIYQFDNTSDNSGDNRSCTSEREQGKRRSHIVAEVELDLLLHGYDKKH